MKLPIKLTLTLMAIGVTTFAEAVTFTEKDAFNGAAPVIVSSGYFPHIAGQALADFDNDGDLDLYVTNGMGYSNYLYLNDGSGNFINVTGKKTGLLTDVFAASVAAADLDGDGWVDLLVGVQASASGKPHPVFLRNMGRSDNGVPQFEDLSAEVGLSTLDDDFRALGFAVADLDGDTDLDVYMAGFNLAYSGDVNLSVGTSTPNVLLRNDLKNGKIRFVDISAPSNTKGGLVAGRTSETKDTLWYPHTWVVYASDVNNDRLPDLIALNDAPGRIDVLLNKGGMKFELMKNPQVSEAGGWMGVTSADFNRDGYLDYFFTNLGSQLAGLDVPQEINLGSIYQPGGTFSHKLIFGFGRQLFDGSPFVRISPSEQLPPRTELNHRRLSAYEFGWGASAIDADNDGWEDLYWTGASYPGLPFGGIGRFFKNHRGLHFKDRTYEAGLFNVPDPKMPDFENHFNGYSVLDADIDSDGDLDLVVLNSGDGTSVSAGTVRVMENTSPDASPKFLSVSLQGVGSNRQGIGSKVRILPVQFNSVKKLKGTQRISKRKAERISRNHFRNVPYLQEAVVTTSAFSSNAPILHFGLGDAQGNAYLVSVDWASGGESYFLTGEKRIHLSK